MRIFLIIILFTFISIKTYANNLYNKSIPYLFKHHYYTYLCLHRWKYINEYVGKREDLLSIVAYACLKKHYLTYALDVARNLRYTKEGRINSTYIITLFFIKNLLMRYIEDNFNISYINIPNIKSDVLGQVFILTKKLKPKVSNNQYALKIKNKKIVVKYDLKYNEIIIDYFNNKKLIKKDIYW